MTKHRRYGLYSPRRRSRASTHAEVLRRRYERSWIAPGGFTSVFGDQCRGSIKHEAQEQLGRETAESKTLRDKGAFLGFLPELNDVLDEQSIRYNTREVTVITRINRHPWSTVLGRLRSKGLVFIQAWCEKKLTVGRQGGRG